MYLRAVEEKDLELLFQWVNDNECRKNAFSTEKISIQEHKKWFKKKINSLETDIFIACIDDEEVGQIRLDYCEEGAIIDYSIAKEKRGNGLGAQMLKLLEKEMKQKQQQIKLIGKVKFDNISSQKTFEKQGYEKKECKKYIQYCKFI